MIGFVEALPAEWQAGWEHMQTDNGPIGEQTSKFIYNAIDQESPIEYAVL